MIRSIFNFPYIFTLKPLFFEKNEIEWNQRDRHMMGNFSQFESSPIIYSQTMYFLEPIKWRLWDPLDIKFGHGR